MKCSEQWPTSLLVRLPTPDKRPVCRKMHVLNSIICIEYAVSCDVMFCACPFYSSYMLVYYNVYTVLNGRTVSPSYEATQAAIRSLLT